MSIRFTINIIITYSFQILQYFSCFVFFWVHLIRTYTDTLRPSIKYVYPRLSNLSGHLVWLVASLVILNTIIFGIQDKWIICGVWFQLIVNHIQYHLRKVIVYIVHIHIKFTSVLLNMVKNSLWCYEYCLLPKINCVYPLENVLHTYIM